MNPRTGHALIPELPASVSEWPISHHPLDEHVAQAGHDAAKDAQDAHDQGWSSAASAFCSNYTTAWRIATTDPAPLPEATAPAMGENAE